MTKKTDDYDLYLTFFSKKVEKIVSAIYLVTEYFYEEESLRWQLRKKGLQLLSDTMSLSENNLSYREKNLSDIKRTVLKTISFLEVSLAINIITEMNMEILKRELNLLLKFIEKGFGVDQGSDVSLKGDFFKVKGQDLETKIVSEKKVFLPKGQSKGQNKVSFKKQSFISGKPSLSNNEKKEARKSRIVKLFDKGQKLTIKDISQVIDDCGEKTIQRELVSMMKEGSIKKEGERRWSQYSLK